MQTYPFKTALLIDDNEVDILVHQKMIQSLSIAEQIISKCSAIEALEFITHEIAACRALPEIIFLDINMPKMNGFEFLDQLQKLSSALLNKTKIIMLSSTINKVEINRIKAHPFVNNFICKPLTLAALMQVIEITLPNSN